MAETPTFITTPTAMEGHGAYNRSSQVQAAGRSPAVPLLQKAARLVPLPPLPQPIVMADYGSSQGGNSLLPTTAAIHALRERANPERAIWVVHTDVRENDFSMLFQRLNTDPDSYLCQDRATFAMAVGRSFYEQILPSKSVTLGWSSWAVQWLSQAGIDSRPVARGFQPRCCHARGILNGRRPPIGEASSSHAAANFVRAVGW